MLRLPGEYVARLRPKYEGRRVCVTGGAGFIGGHVVDALLSLGASIAVIDDLSNSTTGHLAELVELEPERVRFVHASILDDAGLRDAMSGAGVVFHLAAVASVPRSVAEPERCYTVNAVGTMRVAQAARAAGVKRIVYSASSSAYGDGDSAGGGNGAGAGEAGGGGVLPKVETQAPAPLSPYAASKVAGEHIMLAWARSYGLSAVSLRYFNVFGPRQPVDSPYSAVIAAFAKRLLGVVGGEGEGEEPVIYGDGRQSRDFTYVTNAVLANLLAGVSPRALAGEAVNVGTGRRVEVIELARMMAQECGAGHVGVRHQPARAADVRHSLADLTRARELLGYEPVVSLEEGLRATIAWYRGVFAGA